MPSDLVSILVLDDGETYSSLDGCSIIFVTNEQHDQLIDGEVRIRDIKPVKEILFREIMFQDVL